MKEMKLQDLKPKSPTEMLSFAEETGVENASTHAQAGADVRDAEAARRQRGRDHRQGVVEVLQDGFGFLRSPDANYLPAPTTSTSRPPRSAASRCAPATRSKARSAAPRTASATSRCSRSTRSTSRTRSKTRHKVHFDNLTPLYPDERFKMEIEDPTRKDLSPRVIDIVSPIGKGQRALIVSPPRTGKTVLLQNIAHSITANHPECYLIVLLIDGGPRGRRPVGGPQARARQVCPDAPTPATSTSPRPCPSPTRCPRCCSGPRCC